MKLLKLTRQLADGRTTEYHRVVELSVSDGASTMMVLFGSWASREDASTQTRPEATYAIEVANVPELYPQLLDIIHALPEWSAGEIVDLTVQEPAAPALPPLTGVVVVEPQPEEL